MWILRSTTRIFFFLAIYFFSSVFCDDDSIKTVPLRTHSLYQPYLDSDLQSRWFDYGGSTISTKIFMNLSDWKQVQKLTPNIIVRADQYIRITSDRQHQSGWLWSRLPLTATNWEIEFEFRITGAGNLYGDGMALWITKQRAMVGEVFGSINKFEGLGIFFDTYKNSRPGVIFPYVMAMLGDGKTDYDHSTDGKEQELAGCSARGIRSANIATKGKLTYFQENYLQLDLMYKTPDTWTTCFHVRNVTLPTVGYLGFTAQTGELSDNHDIITISSRNLYASSANSRSSGGKSKVFGSSRTGDQSSGGWGWFFIKFILFLVVIAGGYIGFTVYRTSKRSSRF